MEERDLSAEFRAHTFDQFAFCFPARSQFIGYPVPGTDDSVERSRRRYSFLWYYPVSRGQELTDVLTDETGHTHDYSIPPPLIRPEHIERLKRNAVALLPPQFAEVVLRSKRHMVQPIYDVESTRIGFDRVALLGDAAFVARPHAASACSRRARTRSSSPDASPRTPRSQQLSSGIRVRGCRSDATP